MNRNEGGAYQSNAALLLGHESYEESPVFDPANLVQEARRQKRRAYEQVLRILRASATAERWLAWDELVLASLPGQ
jgi:hypothetical protein